MFPVFAPVICWKYGIKLLQVVHRETKDGKGRADGQFATAMQHIDVYIERDRLDVVTKRNLVAAIKHGEGIKGCIEDLYNIDLRCDQYIIWDNAFKTRSHMGEIGLENLYRYRQEASTNEVVNTYVLVYK